jgi:hypothetical protein
MSNDNKLWILPHGIAVRDNRHLEEGFNSFTIINNKDTFKSIELIYGYVDDNNYGFKWKSISNHGLYGMSISKLQLTIESKDEIMEEFRKAIEVLEAIEEKLKENTI